MTQRYRLCFPLVGLLMAVLWLGIPRAWAQQTAPMPATTAPVSPAAPPRAPTTAQPPPTTQRCRYLRLALGRDTTLFSLTDSLTIVPATVTANGRAVSYDAATNRYRIVRTAPAVGSDGSRH
ncbi:MAG: hypothetical protein EOO62_33790, partial [Hymenobacter sp.]